MGEHHGVSTTSAMPPAARGSSPPTATAPTTRPKIKIIHIIAPEIIKTDVANFRDLVQRLTGKPVNPFATAGVATTTTSPPPIKQEEEKKETTRKRPAPAAVTTTTPEWSDFAAQQEPSKKKRKIKCEVKVEEGCFGDYYDLGRGSDLWTTMDLSPGGFMSFLEEEAADVFQGLAAADDFLLPALGSSRLDLVGEMYAS